MVWCLGSLGVFGVGIEVFGVMGLGLGSVGSLGVFADEIEVFGVIGLGLRPLVWGHRGSLGLD